MAAAEPGKMYSLQSRELCFCAANGRMQEVETTGAWLVSGVQSWIVGIEIAKGEARGERGDTSYVWYETRRARREWGM